MTSPQAPEVFRGKLIASFTADELSRTLAAPDAAPKISLDVARFGQVIQTLHAGPQKDVDFAIVWTLPEAVVPGFQTVLQDGYVADVDLLEQVDAYCDRLLSGCQGYRVVFVPTWTPPPGYRGLGPHELRGGWVLRALEVMNLRLLERLGPHTNAWVLFAESWLERVGPQAATPKWWYRGKMPFHSRVFGLAAEEIRAGLDHLSGRSRAALLLPFKHLDAVVRDADAREDLVGLLARGLKLAVCGAERRTGAPALSSALWLDAADPGSALEEAARHFGLPPDRWVFATSDETARRQLQTVFPGTAVIDFPEDGSEVRAGLHALPSLHFPPPKPELSSPGTPGAP